MRVTRLIEEYLPVWILLAAALGLLLPELAVITRASTPILAVMVGSTAMTLSLGHFRALTPGSIGRILLGHALMPVVGYAIARGLGLPPELIAGFVLLGAVTPELVTPTMTELAGGRTALASVALVLIGIGSTAFVPGVVAIFVGDIPVEQWRIVEGLLLAVVLPMCLAVGLRTRFGDPIARYDAWYSTISAAMVILIIAGVSAANAGLVRSSGGLLLAVGIGAVALNLLGYGIGWGVMYGEPEGNRIAGVLSVGMRDFAIAAALVVSAGFPPSASLPAVLFGVFEMVSSAGLARYFAAK